MKPEERKRDLYFLKLLSRSFPNVATASTEIINLEAILNLPKGTEHFLADLHGEYLAFQHVLRNASGTIKRKVGEIFNDSLSTREQKDLCTLIYYPSEKLELVKSEITDSEELHDWYFITINRLVKVCRNVSSKYSRSKVHKALPQDFSYIIQELMHEHSSDPNKQAYVDVIVRTIISTHRSDEFITAMCNLIQQLTIDMLHILGDVYDRGPSPDKIMDILCGFHNFDIQWGNHDILWMGAAAGNDCSIANVLRIALRYGNHGVLEDGYGINLLPLATFAIDTYADDPCERFLPKDGSAKDPERARTAQLVAQMHKAISIIQFKLEAAAIKRRPDFDMNDRLLLDKMNLKKGIIKIAGKEYELLDTNFPTVDPKHPYELTPEEASIVSKLHQSFTESEKLRKHMKCMFSNGCLYTIANGNLLYHASIPLNDDGTLKDVAIRGERFHGKALLKRAGTLIREAYFGCEDPDERAFALDYLWYLWCGQDSPAFDKSKMATFERYFIADKETHKEVKGAYYTMRDNPQVVDMILDEFGVTGEHRHIINGHVPVKTIKGENPIKAEGKLMVIDGGFSKAYQPETGIAGYTLVYHSRGFDLVQHEPFSSIDEAVRLGQDIKSRRTLVEHTNHRMHVKDTDIGVELQSQIEDLKELLEAYRSGDLKERNLRPITNKT
jgi:fructose-1,6-bisphosphatase-3